MKWKSVGAAVKSAHKDADDYARGLKSPDDGRVLNMYKIGHLRNQKLRELIAERLPGLSKRTNEADLKIKVLDPVVAELELQLAVMRVVNGLLKDQRQAYQHMRGGTNTNRHSASVEIRGHGYGSVYEALFHHMNKLSDEDAVRFLKSRLEPFETNGTVPTVTVTPGVTFSGQKLYVVTYPLFDD